jgi:hypothetical protein
MQRLFLRVAVLVSLTVMSVVTTAAPSSAFTYKIGTCRQHVTFKLWGNGKYVAAETSDTGGYYGMLRARASTVGAPEKFTVCTVTGTKDGDVIKSEANGRWVTAEFGYTGSNWAMLRARATSIGAWQVFGCLRIPTGSWSMLLDGPNPTHAYWVAAELHYPGARYGELRDRVWVTNRTNSWNQFTTQIASPLNVFCGD